MQALMPSAWFWNVVENETSTSGRMSSFSQGDAHAAVQSGSPSSGPT